MGEREGPLESFVFIFTAKDDSFTDLLDEAVEILNELQKSDKSVKIAEKYAHPENAKIKGLSNDQLDKKAQVKEYDRDLLNIIFAIKNISYVQTGIANNSNNISGRHGQGDGNEEIIKENEKNKDQANGKVFLDDFFRI